MRKVQKRNHPEYKSSGKLYSLELWRGHTFDENVCCCNIGVASTITVLVYAISRLRVMDRLTGALISFQRPFYEAAQMGSWANT